MLGSTRIFLCTEDTNMCKSFDALHAIIRRSMHLDPLSDALFIFKNKRSDRIKVVYWDGDGMVMWYKLLLRGTYQFPDLQDYSSAGIEIDASTLRMILDRIDLSSIRRRDRYRAAPACVDVHPTSSSPWRPF